MGGVGVVTRGSKQLTSTPPLSELNSPSCSGILGAERSFIWMYRERVGRNEAQRLLKCVGFQVLLRPQESLSSTTFLKTGCSIYAPFWREVGEGVTDQLL